MNESDIVVSDDLAQDESAKAITRGFTDMLIGIALLAGGLVAMCFPVYLDAYDQWGMQVNCGNGYHGELLQATVDDSGGVDPQSAATGAPRIVRPALHYVDSCNSALVHRRAWAVPVAGAGAVILILELLAWARGGSTTATLPVLLTAGKREI
ncbi:hypothetical protein [Mycobacterium kyorinense]|uniref:Transmembrane protein n=1 Tax=Mycobacterium kyorinense TaxID=487514 RepID=A0A1X1Y9P9_9MYCO|nr:hypothetical protein [Mycobacterium kyorinense]ORW07842.1 hypothetical protein AWC14_24420 [Mycobacterium kyorinense]